MEGYGENVVLIAIGRGPPLPPITPSLPEQLLRPLSAVRRRQQRAGCVSFGLHLR